MIDTKTLSDNYDYVIGCKKKDGDNFMSEQDKKHIRILAILQLARDQQIDYVLHHKFNEKFVYDTDNQMGYYCIKIIKGKEGKKYADC